MRFARIAFFLFAAAATGCVYRTPTVPAPPTGDAIVSTRVVIEDESSIDDAMKHDGLAAVALLAAPFGFVMSRARVSVDVTIERDGKTLVGHGTAERLGSIYAPARKRAIAVALERAIANASEI